MCTSSHPLVHISSYIWLVGVCVCVCVCSLLFELQVRNAAALSVKSADLESVNSQNSQESGATGV